MIIKPYFKLSLFAILNTLKFFTRLNFPFKGACKIKVCFKVHFIFIKFKSFLTFVVQSISIVPMERYFSYCALGSKSSPIPIISTLIIISPNKTNVCSISRGYILKSYSSIRFVDGSSESKVFCSSWKRFAIHGICSSSKSIICIKIIYITFLSIASRII